MRSVWLAPVSIQWAGNSAVKDPPERLLPCLGFKLLFSTPPVAPNRGEASWPTKWASQLVSEQSGELAWRRLPKLPVNRTRHYLCAWASARARPLGRAAPQDGRERLARALASLCWRARCATNRFARQSGLANRSIERPSLQPLVTWKKDLARPASAHRCARITRQAGELCIYLHSLRVSSTLATVTKPTDGKTLS